MSVYIIACLYLVLFRTIVHETQTAIIVIDKGIIPIEKGSIGIQFYVNIENDHNSNYCRIHSWPKMCCLDHAHYRDCFVDTIYGDDIKSLMPKRSETLIYVYPTLYQYDQIGSCDIAIVYKCGKQKRSFKIDVTIPFNTEIKRNKKNKYLKDYINEQISACDSIDEDSLHKCAPINCDLKYGGTKPFFDVGKAKCTNAPNCETNLHKKLPDIVYVPKSNICRDLDQYITLGDIYGISTGLGVVSEPLKRSPNDLKVHVVSNCTTISENLILLKDLMSGRLCPLFNGDTSEYRTCYKNSLFSICACITTACALMLCLICGMHSIVWFYKRWMSGELKSSFRNWKSKLTRRGKNASKKPSHLSRELTNNLLKEVLIRDLPLELRDSVVELCDRINKEVKMKKRYRMADLGSQINLIEDDSQVSTASSSIHDDEN